MTMGETGWLVVLNIYYCPFHIWDVILPIDELYHFSRWLASTTNQLLLTIINHIITIYQPWYILTNNVVDPRIIHPQVVPGNVSLSAHCWAPCLCGEDEDTEDTEDTALTSGKLKRDENGIRRGDTEIYGRQ